MELYIIETIGVAILAIIVAIILKVKHVQKIGLAMGILAIIFILAIGLTFLFEKPIANIEESQLNLEVKQFSSINIPKTYYHFRDVTDTVRIVGSIDFNKVGSYEIKYDIPTILGAYRVNQTVNIVDTTAPEITLNGEKIYNQSYAKEYAEPGYNVIDNYDENLVEKVQVYKEEISQNEYNLVYTVEDSSKNTATVIRKVYIVDDVAPEITLNGNANMKILLNSKYEEKGATANDEKDGDLSAKIQITGSVDTSKTGVYTITYKVIDNSGNEATQTRNVIVYEQVAQSPNDANNGIIYLTFDDGPTTSITPKILDILKEKNVKATFFILNYNSTTEELVKREINEGHTVGIHGYSHDYDTIYQSVDAYMSNITKLQDKIKESTGYNATITRFPGGSSNTVSRYNPGIMTILCEEVVARGYKYFDWNVSSEDAGGAKTSQDVYNNVTKGLKKDRVNVVLMHDFGGNTKTLNALADIIDYGLNNGYTFSNITENTTMVTHHVNN